MITVGSCFSGIGGLELGLEWTGGFETKWQIENNPYATKVLARHWPNVTRYGDIREVSFPERVDVLCGGFPCQDVSLAGKREGLAGKRTTLWGEMFRLVCEVRPSWVLAENVPGLLSSDDGRFFGNILRDLASIGYDAEWGMLSAAGVGAPHQRRRVFIMAHPTSWRRITRWTKCARQERSAALISSGGDVAHAERSERRPSDSEGRDVVGEGGIQSGRQKDPGGFGVGGAPLANTKIIAKRESADQADQAVAVANERNTRQEPGSGGWWATEPNVGRVAHGIPARVDRLRCLGNAVVPQVAQRIGEMILKYEKNNDHRNRH